MGWRPLPDFFLANCWILKTSWYVSLRIRVWLEQELVHIRLFPLRLITMFRHLKRVAAFEDSASRHETSNCWRCIFPCFIFTRKFCEAMQDYFQILPGVLLVRNPANIVPWNLQEANRPGIELPTSSQSPAMLFFCCCYVQSDRVYWTQTAGSYFFHRKQLPMNFDPICVYRKQEMESIVHEIRFDLKFHLSMKNACSK